MRNNKIEFVDELAFEYLFKKYFARLDAYAFRFVNSSDTAKDIVQEAFIAIWEKKEHIAIETFENYLFVAVRNRCLSYLKKLLIEKKELIRFRDTIWMEEIYRIDFLKDGACSLIETELQNQIDAVIKNLPPRCKQVFILSREKGLKNREIADYLGISIKNVERHISSALKIFRKKFGNELGIVIFYYLFANLL